MRFWIWIRYVGLLAPLLAGCSTSADQDYDLFEMWSVDSIKHVLKTNEVTGKRAMTANGGLGLKYVMSGQYDSARIYLNRALAMPGGREFQGGRLITNLANSYGFEGRYDEALKYYMEALQMSERLAATKKHRNAALFNVIRTMANLAEIHYLAGNCKQALYYAEQAKERSEENGRSYITPQYLYIIGSVHLDKGEWDDAEKAMRETSEIADTICRASIQDSGNPLGMYMYVAYGREGLARVALARNDHDKALEYAIEALAYADLHGDPTITAKMQSAVSDIYLAKGGYEESGEYARLAMQTIADYAKMNPDAAFNVATSYLFSGDEKKAYDYYRLYSRWVKENTDKQFRETMAGMEVIYETEKKEMRIANLERQKILFIIICAACVMLATTIWLVLRQRIRSERREEQLIAANAIIEWEKKERKRFANDLHDGINGKLSAIKLELNTIQDSQNIRSRLDDCIETIRRMSCSRIPVSLERYGLKAALEDYCRLFPNVDFYFFGENRRLDENMELAVYYCAYELVNNAVRHSGAQNINVELMQEGGSVSLTVQDDGCGFDELSVEGGTGLNNIRGRIAAFNGKIDITTSPGRGTETNIELFYETN